MRVSSPLRSLVVSRSGNRCEYCRLHQVDEPFVAFHVEHIIARQHGGLTEASNLALACHYCNLHKGPNLAAIDPADGEMVRLFHPRNQSWDDHFTQRGAWIEGKTPSGRATERLLAMNDPMRVELRSHTLNSD